MYHVIYELTVRPTVSIIIPNCNHKDDLAKCLNSLWEKTTYTDYEVLIVENNSTDEDIFAYYEEIKTKPGVRILTWEKPFNYSAINNWAATFAAGQHLVFLNNDIEIISPDWLEQMLMYTQFKENAVVGAKLYYPDGTIQHAGVIIGLGGVAAHSHKGFVHEDFGYMGRLLITQDLSAVTAAMMMVRRDVFDEVGGFDEDYTVAFNDVDFCLKIREIGYHIIFTPYVEAWHYESKSRGQEDTIDKQQRFQSEVNKFVQRWGYQRRDPFYNPNLTLEREDFSLRGLV